LSLGSGFFSFPVNEANSIDPFFWLGEFVRHDQLLYFQF
jgi:hypothetical protein